MKITGATGIAAGAGTTQASVTDSDRLSQRSSPNTTGTSLDLGGRRIVGTDGYETIAEAWADADDGDTIYVHSSYDAAAADEPFPVELDYREKEVTLEGGHPSASVIDADDTDANVIEIVGTGSADYRNNPLLKNLKIVGGDIGIRVRCAPFAAFENLVVFGTGSHGVLIDSHDDGGTFGTNWYNLQSWNCGGDGLRTVTAATPHGTTLWGCRFTANRGAGVRFRGTTCKMVGGVSQLNYDYGLEARSGYANHLWSAYIEGNARANDFPVDVYARRANGLTIENCYFHGINPRDAEHDHTRVQRAVNVHDTEKLTVRDCVGRRYEDGFLAVFGCTDTDIYAGSHHLEECELFARDPTAYGNQRTRSNGAILPTDLSDVDGAHEYDRGYHVGADGTEGKAVWRNGAWHLAETTRL